MKLLYLLIILSIMFIFVYSINSKTFYVKSKIYPKVSERYKQNIIPKTIVTSSYSNNLNMSLKDSINSLIENNPEYNFLFFNDDDSRKFISKYFGQRVLNAYDTVIPGAYKADLFRYCYIYEKGGVWIDINKKLLVPLNQIIKDNDELVLVNDIPKCCIYQAFFAAIPKHPFIKKCIEKCVENIENNYYGEDPLDPTGPRMMGKVYLEYYGKCLSSNIINSKNKYVEYDGKKIIDTRPINRNIYGFINTLKGKPHYSQLWYLKRIYK